MPDSTYRGEAILSLLQEEEGAGPGAAVAHLDQRGPTARHGAPRLGRRGGLHPYPQARRVLPVLQRHRPLNALG